MFLLEIHESRLGPVSMIRKYSQTKKFDVAALHHYYKKIVLITYIVPDIF